MTKRLFILLSLAFVILIPHGVDATLYSANVDAITKQKQELTCDSINENIEKDIRELAEILNQNNYESLQDRINQLASSMETLEAEKNLVQHATCVDVVDENRILLAQMNTYHSLLVYAMEMKKREDIQFDKLTMESSDHEALLQLEALLQNSDDEVHIDHYYSTNGSSAYNKHEIRLMEEELEEIEEGPPSVMMVIITGLTSSAYQFFQNPIEKFISMVDNYFSGRTDMERELFRKETSAVSMGYSVYFSIIMSKSSNWNEFYMAEYYPTGGTYLMIDRAQKIQQELPSFWYPEEAIENKNWNEIIKYYDEHHYDIRDYSQELYEYLTKGYLPKNMSPEGLLEQVKKDNPGVE